jgi:hypothetical protein
MLTRCCQAALLGLLLLLPVPAMEQQPFTTERTNDITDIRVTHVRAFADRSAC